MLLLPVVASLLRRSHRRRAVGTMHDLFEELLRQIVRKVLVDPGHSTRTLDEFLNSSRLTTHCNLLETEAPSVVMRRQVFYSARSVRERTRPTSLRGVDVRPLYGAREC